MRTTVAASLVAVAIGPLIAAQSSDSQTRAIELARRLGSEGPTFFAAAVPDDPSRFVAVMHFPGVQSLVISARYQAPALLRELIMKDDYQRVYLDLHAAADREGRFFVEDLGSPGLRAQREGDEPFDITWRNAVERTLYHGDWKELNLSEAEYRQRFDKDAADYAQLLQVLLSAHASDRPSPVPRLLPRTLIFDCHFNGDDVGQTLFDFKQPVTSWPTSYPTGSSRAKFLANLLDAGSLETFAHVPLTIAVDGANGSRRDTGGDGLAMARE